MYLAGVWILHATALGLSFIVFFSSFPFPFPFPFPFFHSPFFSLFLSLPSFLPSLFSFSLLGYAFL